MRQLHSNLTSLPEGKRYWITWMVPHVFFANPESVLIVPKGWQERELTFDHWTLGGSMMARCCLVVCYPPEVTPCKSVTAPTQPWIPLHLHAQIDGMVRLTPWEAPPNLELLHLEVTPLANGKAILTGGLFSHQQLCQVVWVRDAGYPTKYGCCWPS